jgi:TolB protein
LRVLGPDPAEDASPAWAPDGSAVYFVSDRSGTDQIWRAGLGGSSPVQVSSDAAAAVTCGPSACPILGRPAASPGGTELAFARATADSRSRVVILDLGSGVERLLSEGEDIEPSWSPDGSEIAVMSVAYGDPEVVVRDVSTGAIRRRLTEVAGIDGAPSYGR